MAGLGVAVGVARTPVRTNNLKTSKSPPSFGGVFAGARVLVTGHTGFKGAWLALWLHRLGAQVHGFALEPPTSPSLFDAAQLRGRLASDLRGDVRDLQEVEQAFRSARPTFVFHLAAQPLVLAGYDDPLGTLQTNVLGTANVLEAARRQPSVKVVQAVTTDKCYENDDAGRPFKETDPLGGKDPYSASKAAAELVVRTYRDSFFASAGRVSLASVRGGNVVGGGDWAAERLVPDLARAFEEGKPPRVRNPMATRPWQYVLDLLSGYLWLAARQRAQPSSFAGPWNFGPAPGKAVPVSTVVAVARQAWGPGARAPRKAKAPAAEAQLLALDSTKARKALGWRPLLDAPAAVAEAISWYRQRALADVDAALLCDEAIARHEDLAARMRAVWA